MLHFGVTVTRREVVDYTLGKGGAAFISAPPA